jgi:hypothetical protein
LSPQDGQKPAYLAVLAPWSALALLIWWMLH